MESEHLCFQRCGHKLAVYTFTYMKTDLLKGKKEILSKNGK